MTVSRRTVLSMAPAMLAVRLYADGKFDRHGREDKKALFCAGAWRGLQAKGKTEQKAAFPFLINNGRSNINWQNCFLDQDNDFVADRFPYPYIQISPDDMAGLGVKAGDLVEVYNDVGATQAMVYPTPTAKKARRSCCSARLQAPMAMWSTAG